MAKNLRRELGFWDAVATGIAVMIGAGIFVVSGMGARAAGAAVILAFVVAGVVALFNALSSAELAAAIPRVWLAQIYRCSITCSWHIEQSKSYV